jgi:ketosteroid isomerase-like protein
MDANAGRLNELFSALNAHDHAAIARCYHEDAVFRDIAFHLCGRKRIHAMWHLICETDIRTEVKEISADEVRGRALVVDTYTFSDTGRVVRNEIVGHFSFEDGLILDHRDECDPLAWARQAFGGVKGEIIGRVALLRRIAARKKISKVLAQYPQYR